MILIAGSKCGAVSPPKPPPSREYAYEDGNDEDFACILHKHGTSKFKVSCETICNEGKVFSLKG